MPPALVEAVGRITGRDRVARAGPDWIPDHERRVRRRVLEPPPPIVFIRVVPVDPPRLTA
jgi:hypothetical protein